MTKSPRQANTAHPHAPGPRPALPTRRVMAPLLLFGAVLVLLLGFNAPEPPAFKPIGMGGDGLTLALTDPTPAASLTLEDDFVPADEQSRQEVLRLLDAFSDTWSTSAPKISVTPMDIDAGTVAFAQQLDDWLSDHGLSAAGPVPNDGLGQFSHPPEGSGFVIRCRQSILFSSRSKARHLDVFLEGAPRFNAAGVAYFPAVGGDV